MEPSSAADTPARSCSSPLAVRESHRPLCGHVREGRRRPAADDRRRLVNEIVVLQRLDHEQGKVDASSAVALEDGIQRQLKVVCADSRDKRRRTLTKRPLSDLGAGVRLRFAPGHSGDVVDAESRAGSHGQTVEVYGPEGL